MSWLLKFFFPEEVDFFTPMARMYSLILKSVDTYISAAQKTSLAPEDRDALLSELKSLEREGDDIIREINAGLKRTFTPPYSPVELRNLFEGLDDALDRLYESAMTNITAGYAEGFPPFVKDQLEVFRRGMIQAAKTVELLKKPRDNSTLLAEIIRNMSDLEAEGDRVYWPNKRTLSAKMNMAAAESRLDEYRGARMDEIILDQMEEVNDFLVHISKVIDGMILEHA